MVSATAEFTNPPPQEWHGWAYPPGTLALHVGRLPKRKSVVLYAVDGSKLWVLAYFRSEEDAQRAMAILDRLIWPGGPG